MAVLLLFTYLLASAQQQHEWEQYLYQIGEMEDMEAVDWEAYFDMFCDFEASPLNINTATREELEQFPFLSAKDLKPLCRKGT